jgi:hypothetical protein
MAQFEREMMLERQREGIAKAKAQGKYKGRKPTARVKAQDAIRLFKEGKKVAHEIRLLDYIEGVGQPLAYYAHELRRRGWKDAIIYLPHDGVATNNITGKRYIDH